MRPPPTFADVLAARERLRGHAHETPVMTSTALNDRVGAVIRLKCENLQRIGAFKFRGAFNAIAQISEADRQQGVVTFSSGNHAQAVALVGRLLNTPTTIVMPADVRSWATSVPEVGARRGTGRRAGPETKESA